MRTFCSALLTLGLFFGSRCDAQQEIPAADDLYRIAVHSMQKEDLPKAKTALTMLVLQYPNDERQGLAHLILAQVYLKESDFFAAQLALERIAERYADSKDTKGAPILPTVLTFLGGLYSGMKQEAAAQEAYDRLRREFPDAVDDNGEKFVNSIPEQYRSGSAKSSAPSSVREPPEIDKETKQKIYRELQGLVEKARAEAASLYPDSPEKRKEHVARKTEIAAKSLAIKYKISPEDVLAVDDEGKKEGW